MIFGSYFSAQTQGQAALTSINHQKTLKYQRNSLILLPRQGKISATSRLHICSDNLTDADYLIPPVVPASSDVKLKKNKQKCCSISISITNF